jgi:galactokinase
MNGFIVKAPGRVNLIGEHTDYNAGKVLPFAIDQHIYVTVKIVDSTLGFIKDLRFDFETTMKGQPRFVWIGNQISDFLSRDSSQHDFSSDLGSNGETWQAYIIGAIHMHFKQFPQTPCPVHVKIAIDSSLPSGAGISSSAALCCGMLAALAKLQGVTRDPIQLATDAMLIEHRFAKTNCGLMDQLAITMSKRNQFTEIDFSSFYRGGAPKIAFIEAHPIFSQYELLTINTMVKHKLSDSPYNQRRDTCTNGLIHLNKHLGLSKVGLGEFADEGQMWGEVGIFGNQQKLKEWLVQKVQLPPSDASKVAHAICENIRVDRAAKALVNGDLASLTLAINESHDSLAKDYEVSCLELDLLRRTIAVEVGSMAKRMNLSVPGLLGSRMTGGGFGGSTVQFVHQKIVPSLVAAFTSPENLYSARTKKIPVILETPPSTGLEIEILK